MDKYKPRLYTKIKYSKERLENVDPHTHAVKYSNIDVHGSMKVFYTNELNKEKSANFLREGIIDCDMRNKDIYELSDKLKIGRAHV